MADPLAISTAIITFAGAAIKITNEITDIIHGFKSADQDLLALNAEVKDLESILRSLTKLQSSIKRIDPARFKNAGFAPDTLKTTQQDLAALKITLLAIRKRANGSRVQRWKARYEFSQRKRPTITSFIARIQTSKSSLTLALTVFHAHQGEDTLKELRISNSEVAKLSGAQAEDSIRIVNLQDSLEHPSHGLQAIETSNGIINHSISRVEQSLSSSNTHLQKLKSSASRMTNDVEEIKQSLLSIDQRTKIQRTQTHSHLPDGICHIISYPPNDRFTGRMTVLSQMESTLLSTSTQDGSPLSFALCGMPGVGKTQTALRFVYDHRNKFPAIFWISASSKDKLIMGYGKIARSLGLTGDMISSDQDETVRIVKTWFSSTDTKWLLVLDNVDSIEDITEFWPSARKGAILLTTQDPKAAQALTKTICKLSPFTPDEGIELIEAIVKSTGTSMSSLEAGQVARALGYHPLAINQMANFIIDTNCTVPLFLELYAQREQSNQLQGINCQSPWYENTVAAAFDLIIERAGKLGSQAAKVLDVFSLFDPDRIQEEMLSRECLDVSSDVHRLLAITDLRRMALLNDNTEKCMVSVHRLVQDAVLRKLGMDEMRANEAFATAVSLLRKVFPIQGLARDHMTESWTECEDYLSHVLSIHERYVELSGRQSIGASMDFAELLYSCAWYLCERGRFDKSSKLIQTAENVYQALEDKENDLFRADLRTVKLYYANETDHNNSSIDLATEALNIREEAVRLRLLEEDHPNRANGFMNLAVMYAKVNPEKAVELNITALSIRTKTTRFQDQQVHGLALNYLNLGRSYWCSGRLDEAATAFETCLATIKVREEICRQRFALSGWALWALANVQIDRGRLKDALVLHTESMELNEKILGSAHLKTAASYHKMAWLLWKQGELSRAKDILNLAFDVYDNRADELAAERARSKWLLAQIVKDAEPTACEKWRSIFQDAQALRKKVVGTNESSQSEQEDYDNLVSYFYR